MEWITLCLYLPLPSNGREHPNTTFGHLKPGTFWCRQRLLSAEHLAWKSLKGKVSLAHFLLIISPLTSTPSWCLHSKGIPWAVSHSSSPIKVKREKDKGDYNSEKSYCVKHLGGGHGSSPGVAACKIPDARTKGEMIRRNVCVGSWTAHSRNRSLNVTSLIWSMYILPHWLQMDSSQTTREV